MSAPPGAEGVQPAEAFLASLSDVGEADRWRARLDLAEAFIGRFAWCEGIRERHVGCDAGPVSALLLRVAVAGGGPEPEWRWVVAGDGSPLLVDAADAPTPAHALAAYCGTLERWAGAVRAGTPIGDAWPLLTADGLGLLEPTPETADRVEEDVAAIRRADCPSAQRTARVTR